MKFVLGALGSVMSKLAQQPAVPVSDRRPSPAQDARKPRRQRPPSQAFPWRSSSHVMLALIALLVAALLSLVFGTIRLTPAAAMEGLLNPSGGRVATVIWSIRLPRILVAILVGGALAGVGVVMQGVFRNPLADPGITGVSAGAAVGAVAGITFGLSGGLQWGVPLAAFAGSLGVALLLQLILRSARSPGNYTIILVGVSINAFSGAVISILVANAREDALARGAVFWLAGDLELRTWTHAALAAGPILLGVGLLLALTGSLDALLLGDDVASTSGHDAHRTRLALLLIASLITGAAVAVSGIISFVGLVVPHAVRLLVGAKHSLLLPLSVIYGALFLVLTDTIARAATVSVVIQTGAVSALIGAPIFLALLLSRRSA